MSKLAPLIAEANAGLSIQEGIPQARWDAIAQHLGTEEIAEIRGRLTALKEALAAAAEWDGETQDDIRTAISRFQRLLELTGAT